MEAFGDELRGERERRGMSVEAICSITKVSYRHLESLEANRFSELPGGVFRKGIVRSYLSALGLEESAWMGRFEDALRSRGMSVEPEGDFTQFAENVKRSRGEFRRGMGWRWLGVLCMALLLGAMGWAAWKYLIRPKIANRPVPVSMQRAVLPEARIEEELPRVSRPAGTG